MARIVPVLVALVVVTALLQDNGVNARVTYQRKSYNLQGRSSSGGSSSKSGSKESLGGNIQFGDQNAHLKPGSLAGGTKTFRSKFSMSSGMKTGMQWSATQWSGTGNAHFMGGAGKIDFGAFKGKTQGGGSNSEEEGRFHRIQNERVTITGGRRQEHEERGSRESKEYGRGGKRQKHKKGGRRGKGKGSRKSNEYGRGGKRQKHKKGGRRGKGKGSRKSNEYGRDCDFQGANLCYTLGRNRKSFSNAERDCQEQQGHLASLNSSTVQNLVYQYTRKRKIREAVWFGLYQKKNDWYFTDKASFNPRKFSKWEKGEPNDMHTKGERGADCAVLWPDSNAQWRDRSCKAEYLYLCQKPLASFRSQESQQSGSEEDESAEAKPRDASCPSGSFTNSGNGRCYKVYNEKRCWQDAFKQCRDDGGNLAVFDDQKTIDFLKKKVKKDVWISYTDRAEEGQFVLHYGDTDQEVKFTYFKDKQPNGKREQNCLMATGKDNLKAQDKRCSESKDFLCEFRKSADKAIEYSRVCKIEGGFRLKAERSVAVDDCENVDKCVGLCDKQRTCLAFNYYKNKKRCEILFDNVFTLGREKLGKDNNCVFGTHRSRRFTHCPPEADIRNPETSICYRYYTDSKNWHDAQEECGNDGGQLAIIDNQQTYEFIKKNAQGFRDTYFIGGSDEEFKGEFSWYLDDLRAPCGKTFWKKNQPNDPDQEQNCLVATADSNQEWQDKPCSEKKNFLCQYAPKGYSPDCNYLGGLDKYPNVEINLEDTGEEDNDVDVETCAKRAYRRKGCIAVDYNRKTKRCRYLRTSKFTQPKSAKKTNDVDHYVIKSKQYSHCPKGCVKLPKSDRCFELRDDEATWDAATKNCNQGKFSGNLVAMDNNEIVNLFSQVKKRFKKPFWSACNRKGSRDFGFNIFGNQERLGKLRKWRGGKPKNDEKKRCVRVRNDDLNWEEENCDAKYPYVCEYRPPGASFSDNAIESFLKFNGQRLKERRLRITKNSNEQDCAGKCVADEKCLSFNFYSNTKACELSRQSRQTSPQYMVRERGYVHYVHKGRQISHCPPGTIVNQGNQRCYKIIEKKLSWKDAQEECKNLGGNLAVLPDRSTWKSLADQWPDRSPSEMWIGMISDIKGQMKWRLGVKNFRVGKSFNNWEGRNERKHKDWFRGRKEPMCGCARSKTLDWKLSSCGDRKSVICEFRAEGNEQVTANCPEGWESYGGMCYVLEKNKLGFNDAREICKLYGAELLSVASRDENNFLAGYLRGAIGGDGTPIWLGLTDQEREMNWVFLDGTDWESGFSNWDDPRDPYRRDKDDCAAITSSSNFKLMWRDRSCNSKYYYMCKARSQDIKSFGCNSGTKQCITNARCQTTKLGAICVCKPGFTATMREGELTSCDKSAVCYVRGDPHIYTFDGKRLDYQGSCRYTYAKPCSADPTGDSMFNVTVQHQYRNNKYSVTWVKTVYVEAYGVEVALLGGRQMKVNGDHRHPGVELVEGKIKTELEGCRTLVVTLVDLGVRVSLERDSIVHIEIPGRYYNKMCGICGNFNDNRDDDLNLAYSTEKGDNTAIGNSWLTYSHPDDLEENTQNGHEDCTVQETPVTEMCSAEDKELFNGESMCGWLLTKRFQKGHDLVDPSGYILECAFDLCAGMDVEQTLCTYAENYAQSVERKNGKMLWRENTPCAPECPENSVFKSSVSTCPDTCQNPDASSCCTRGEKEGCECLPGYLLSGTKCVPTNECGCMDMPREIYRQTGDVWTDGKCRHRYTCQADGTILAEDITCHESARCRRNIYGKQGCHCKKGYKGDGITECKDIDECTEKKKVCGRDGKCKNTPGSFECEIDCEEGYKPRRGKCQDINECRMDDKGGCSHICVNLPGTYQCECPVGMTPGDDGKTCKQPKDCGDGVDLSDVEPSLESKPYSTKPKPQKDWIKLSKERRKKKEKERKNRKDDKDDSDDDSDSGSKENKGGRRKKNKGGSSENKKGGSSENKKGGSSENKKGGSSENKKGGSSENKKGGSSENKKGGSSENKKGGSSENKKGGSSENKKGGSSENKKGGSSENKKGGSSEIKKGGSSENKKGGSSENKKGGSSENKKGGSSENKKGGSSENKKGGSSSNNKDKKVKNQSPKQRRLEKKREKRLEILRKLKAKDKAFVEDVKKDDSPAGRLRLIRERLRWTRFQGKDNGNDAVDNEKDNKDRAPEGDRNWINSPDECEVAENPAENQPLIKGDGFKLNAKTGKCQDINECTAKTHKCPEDAVCKNTIGSYNCQCEKGRMVSFGGKLACEDWAKCRGSGDPHYYTLDGIKIDFMGTCTYTLIKPCPVSKKCNVPYFNVEVKNWRKPNRKTTVSFTRFVLVYIGDAMIQLGPGAGNVYIKDVSDNLRTTGGGGDEDSGLKICLPVENHRLLAGVTIKESGRYMVVTSDFLVVKYDGNERFEVTIPSHIYKNIGMCGLCGNFNGDKSDELVDRFGSDAGDSDVSRRNQYTIFGNSWKVPSQDWDETCDPPLETEDLCETEEAKTLVQSDTMCGIIKSLDKPFANCISFIESNVEGGEEMIESLYGECYFDVCSDYENKEDELCKALTGLGELCRGYGYPVNWRSEDFCPVECGRNMVYQYEMTACPVTCSNTKADPNDCPLSPVEGCACKNGLVRTQGGCVRPEQCGCFDMDRGYIPLGTAFITDDCSQMKVCQNGGNIHVSDAAKCHAKARCRVRKGERGCHCKKGWRRGEENNRCDDEDECADKTHRCSKHAVCVNRPGSYDCSCLQGYTGDGKICNELPSCAEGFKRGRNLQCEDIDECVNNPCGKNARCRNVPGSYKCYCRSDMTGDPYSSLGCSAACVCKTSGDPHFETCDGLSYDYQGSCKYTLAKPCGDTAGLPNFQVDIQNAKWRRSSASYVKYTDVTVCNHVIELRERGVILVDGKRARAPFTLDCDDENKNSVSVANYYNCRSVSVIVKTTFGLVVEWDGRWAVNVKVSGSYAGKLCGLCGNFDGDPDNDPRIKDGELDPGTKDPKDERSIIYNKFGESWRIPSADDAICAVKPVSLCTRLRFAEGLKICKVLYETRGIFGNCAMKFGRSARKYALNCAYDYCVTPDEDVQAVLCHNFEEYIQRCEDVLEEPLSVDWRTPYKCPVVCEDPDMEYRIGVSGCPATVEFPNGDPKCPLRNRNACVCKDGMILMNDKCVLLSSVACVDDHGEFRSVDEEWITDDCAQLCRCEEGGNVCEDGPKCDGPKQSCARDQQGELGCVCQKFYEMNDDGECVDIDECKGDNSCHVDADCTNKDDGYTCKCHPGFEGNGVKCEQPSATPDNCLNPEGKKVPLETTFKRSSCETCTCQPVEGENAQFICIAQSCAPISPYCLEEKHDEGVCCASCAKEGCMDMSENEVALGHLYHPTDLCHTQICGERRVRDVQCEKPKFECDSMISVPGECCQICVIASPPPPPGGCPLISCSKSMGWKLRELPVKADTRLHILRDKTFDCPGIISRVQYYRSSPDGIVYIGVLRPIGDRLRCVGRVTLEEDETGICSVDLELSQQMAVKRGDMLAIWYPQSAKNGVISMAFASDDKQRCFGADKSSCIPGGMFAYSTDYSTYDMDLDLKTEIKVGEPNNRVVLPIVVHIDADRMPLGDEVKLTEEEKPFCCSSRGMKYKECELNGYAMEIHLKHQASRADCIEGVTYGIKQTKIWVDKGCRAKFLVKFCRVSSNCPDGYKFNSKKGKCDDINECKQRKICPRGSPCLNTEGGYKCLAYCGISGDPHYSTFDGARLNFQGECTYTLVKPCPESEKAGIPAFNIRSENKGDDTKPVSWTKRLFVTIEEYEFVIEDGPIVYINGERCSNQFKLETNGHTIKGSMKGCLFSLETSFDLYIYYDPRRKNIKILLPDDYKNIGMCGMCGNYDGDKDNDLKTSEGKYVGDMSNGEYSTLIGNSWESSDGSLICVAGPPPICPPEKVNILAHNSNCGKMKDPTGPFADCIAHLPLERDNYYQQCVLDSCALKDNTEQLCNALSALYDACIEGGYQVTWNKQENCPLVCLENEKYEANKVDCEPTCLSLTNPETCVDNEMEGCFCKAGFVRSGDKCVKKEACGCTYKDTYYELNFEFETCTKKLKCVDGNMQVEDNLHPCGEGEVCRMRSGKRTCKCDGANGYYKKGEECVKTVCKEGQKQFLDRCYEVPPEEKSYNPAREYCYKEGGQMVIITSKQLNKFVKNLLKEKSIPKAFIGLDDQVDEGVFLWSNNSPLKAGDYVNWQEGGPFGANKVDDCAVMFPRTGKWKDVYCSLKLPFVCEFGDFIPVWKTTLDGRTH